MRVSEGTEATEATDLNKRSDEANGENGKLQHYTVAPQHFGPIRERTALCCSLSMLQDPHGTNALTSRIIGCGVHVHRAIGPGLYENVYAECLDYELRLQGLRVERERPVRVTYRGIALKSRYYADFIVEDTAIVELKAVVTLADIHGRQILTLLKLTGLPVGLLINFNVVKLTNGVRRIVNPQLVTVSSANP